MRDAFSSGRIPRGGFQGGPGAGNVGDFSDIFAGASSPQDIFSTLFGGGGRGPRRGGDIQTETSISFRDSIFGTEINLKLATAGAGGSTISTRIPAGINDGAKIKLKGRGAPGQAGPGDLLVIIHVIPHPVFTRKGENLHLTLPVTFTEAALGADISVPTLDGDEVTVRLAPGTPNGRTLRVKGRGVKRNHAVGDLMITVDVQVPQRVDGKAKKALEEFAEATKEFNPRAELSQRAKA